MDPLEHIALRIDVEKHDDDASGCRSPTVSRRTDFGLRCGRRHVRRRADDLMARATMGLLDDWVVIDLRKLQGNMTADEAGKAAGTSRRQWQRWHERERWERRHPRQRGNRRG